MPARSSRHAPLLNPKQIRLQPRGSAPRIRLKQAYIHYSVRVKRLSVRRIKRGPSLRFDFVNRRKLILLVTFAGRGDGYASRMAVLPKVSNPASRTGSPPG